MTTCFGTQGPSLRAGPFRLAETAHQPGMVLPRHSHELECIHWVLGGVYQETTDRGAESYPENVMLSKPAGTIHSNSFAEIGAVTLRIEYPASRDSKLPRLANTHYQDSATRHLATKILVEHHFADPCTPLAVEGLCLELLATLGRAQRPEPKPTTRDLVRQATDLLRESIGEPVRLSRLAEEIGTHRSHLARAFRSVHRCTMGEYLRRLRIQAVLDALPTNKSLAEIAAATGFADQSHLSRVFRRLLGITPTQYRRQQSP